MGEVKIEQLAGCYGRQLASKFSWRLHFSLRIDEHGGCSTWFSVEEITTGKMREFPSLAAALWAYNEAGK